MGTAFMYTWDTNQGVLSSNSFPTHHHLAQVNALELINATHLASGSDDSTVKVWELATGACTLTINTRGKERIKALKLLSSGYLAGGGDISFDIYIWSLTNGSLIQKLAAHNGRINTIAALSDGDFATGADDQRVIIWSLNFTRKFTLIAADAVNCIKQLPNGNLAGVINHFRDNFYIWNLSSLTHSVINAHTKPARSVEVLSNGDIATSSDDLSIKIWSANNFSLVLTLNGHRQPIRVLKLLPNGLLASGSDDSLIKLWNTTNGTLVRDLASPQNTNIKYLALEVLANMSEILFTQNQNTTDDFSSAAKLFFSTEPDFFETSSAKNEIQISIYSDISEIENEIAGATTNEMLESTDSHTIEIESSSLANQNNGLATTIENSDFTSSLTETSSSSSKVESTRMDISSATSSTSESIRLSSTSIKTSQEAEAHTSKTVSTETTQGLIQTTLSNMFEKASTDSFASDTTSFRTNFLYTSSYVAIFALKNSSFNFEQLSMGQTLDLLNSNYDLSGCMRNCSNQGSCKFDLVLNKFYCWCDSIYLSGSACNLDIRPCSSNPCLNNGTCVDYSNNLKYNMTVPDNGTYNCLCNDYYKGENCETKINICQNETCSGNGNCVDLNNKAKCDCFNMYLGEKCDTQSAELKTVKTIISFTSIIAIGTVVMFYFCILLLDFSKYCLRRRKATKQKHKELTYKLVYIN
jgi:WD40 repeat protein